jgi:ketosteroid isomerase-like protein
MFMPNRERRWPCTRIRLAESQTLTDETVIVDGDTAVVVGTDTLRGTKSGAAHTAVARYTVTYIRRNGQWMALAEHLAELPQAK